MYICHMNLFEGKVFYDFFQDMFLQILAEVVSAKKKYHMYIFSLNMEKGSLKSNQYQTNKKPIKN